MAFQESADPFIEKIQCLIDDLEKNVDYREFEETLKAIDEKFPFVDFLLFVERLIDGEYSKSLISRFHISGYSDYYKLLSILKLDKKRATDKNAASRKTNLNDPYLSSRYYFLKEIFAKFEKVIAERISYNVLRAVIILYLFSNLNTFTNRKNLIESLPQSCADFERLILAPHDPLSTLEPTTIESLTDQIILELQNNYFLEIDRYGNFRLATHNLNLSEYIVNILQNKTGGISYQNLISILKEKLPILSLIPLTLIEITIHDLVTARRIIKKEGYWKLRPFTDEYFTAENYRKFGPENLYEVHKSKGRFFGRAISPDRFVRELVQLQKGDFGDEDDQVTRIAGMVLPNTNEMDWPPPKLNTFDFSVNLTNYRFTREQTQLIKELEFEIISQIIHVKVMVNERVTSELVSKLILQLEQRANMEQGFVISFLPLYKFTGQQLKHEKRIQVISEDSLKKWCKITPVVASRKGSVVIIRHGDHRGSIAKITSINYETGLAEIILFPEMKGSSHYIGALEEINLDVSLNKFVDYSNIFFHFLARLNQLADTEFFNKIILTDISKQEVFYTKLQIVFTFDVSSECQFEDGNIAKILFSDKLDVNSLRYTTEDLFSCTCSQWNENSRSQGLCEHLISTINGTVKYLLSPRSGLSGQNIERHLTFIENNMGLFLKRLRYSNTKDEIPKCPNCGQIAYTISSVENLFGYRQMDKDNKFSLRRQSRCKKCR